MKQATEAVELSRLRKLIEKIYRWPIFELDLEIIKTTFLTNFQNIWIKTAATRVLTSFFYFLAPVT
jgi:hypothetical protein